MRQGREHVHVPLRHDQDMVLAVRRACGDDIKIFSFLEHILRFLMAERTDMILVYLLYDGDVFHSFPQDKNRVTHIKKTSSDCKPSLC